MPDFTRKADRAIAPPSAFSFPYTKTESRMQKQEMRYEFQMFW